MKGKTSHKRVYLLKSLGFSAILGITIAFVALISSPGVFVAITALLGITILRFTYITVSDSYLVNLVTYIKIACIAAIIGLFAGSIIVSTCEIKQSLGFSIPIKCAINHTFWEDLVVHVGLVGCLLLLLPTTLIVQVFLCHRLLIND